MISSYSFFIIILYLLSILAVFVSKLSPKGYGNFFAYIFSFTSFVIAGNRPKHFPDVDSYGELYKVFSTLSLSNPDFWSAHGEPGFKIFSYFISYLGFDYSGFLIIFSLSSYLLLFYISKLSKIPFSYLWFAYFSFYFITRDFGVIRLALASHLIVIFFIHNSFFWRWTSIILASLCFQTYAFVVVFIKPLLKIKINFFSISVLFLAAIIASRFLYIENFSFLIWDNHFRNYVYLKNLNYEGYSTLFPIIRNTFYAFFIYFMLRKDLKFPEVRLWVWCGFLTSAVYVGLSDLIIAAQRFSSYFGTIIPLAFAFLIYRTSSYTNLLILLLACIFNFAILFYYNSWIWN